MIDLKDLRQNPDKYKAGARAKNVSVDVDAVLTLDERARGAQAEFDRLRAEQNQVSQQIGRAKDPAEREALKAKAGEFKPRLQQLGEEQREVAAKVEGLLLAIPQPPDDDVPPGRDASDNVVVRHWGEPPTFDFKPKSHIEIGEALGLFDFRAGAKIAGSRSYFLKSGGAELHAAVIRLALDMMTREMGFTPMVVPVMVREQAMKGTGFFPGGRDQAYRVGEVEEAGEDVRFLTGTAEVALTAYAAPENEAVTLNEVDLPLKLTAASTCFRREAGTYGKDTAGLYRVHQFDKVEQVVICRNDVAESKRWHAEMLGYSEELLRRLKLPHRVIQCCTGDLGVKNASMLDIETWMPSRFDGKTQATGYGETHSASRLYEFQARRLNLRYKDKEGKVRFCHTLNNTVVASPRILIPILENYQNADGSVTVPEVLRSYVGREVL
ncbi:MAG: serS [Phycisphaerales bacterium]|nr:serS [Phycisphaerales bacterium]